MKYEWKGVKYMKDSIQRKKKSRRFFLVFYFLVVIAICYAWTQEGKRLNRDQLVEDTRQLASIIESAHPDPYINGGGKIAFHRRLQEILAAIPAEGMGIPEYYKILRPFIAGIQDAHTNIWLPSSGGNSSLGLPIGFEAIDNRVIVARVYSEEHKPILGAVITGVEGVAFTELISRQKRLKPFENEYGNLNNVMSSLGQRKSLEDLLPECRGKDQITVTLRLPDGTSQEKSISLIDKLPSQRIAPPTKIAVPNFDKSDPVYGFLDTEGKVAILRFGNMMGYREAMEYLASVADSETVTNWANYNYERFNKKKSPKGLKETIAGIPSATETFASLVAEMKKAGTEMLLLDVRGNPGGNSFITDILIYFLFGWEIRDSACNTVTISKFSELFFTNYEQRTIEDFGKYYAFPLMIGDYAFPEYGIGDQAEEETLGRYATFAAEKKSGAYEAYFRPKNIVVLISSKTFSSAYWFAADLMKAGAMLVGTPSGQAGNSFGDVLSFTLKNSGLMGGVSYRQFLKFPDDSFKGRLLRPDFELTYEKLRSYNFDPNAEIIWALELFSNQKEGFSTMILE